MAQVPEAVAGFLSGRRIIVAGVSRAGSSPANAIFRKLRKSGYEVLPVNPNAVKVEGQDCYPDIPSVPGPVDGVIVATHPSVSAAVALAALARGIRHIWFHRSFGEGSVSSEALQVCRDHGVEPIEGGCPLMYCQPVDLGHRIFRWWLGRSHRVPA
ncbi:MAG: CoA-binding protein [Holophaga sp.]|nr:CoA-binding protein [Holophaga sp.]